VSEGELPRGAEGAVEAAGGGEETAAKPPRKGRLLGPDGNEL
jgi:hypothetical protein